MPNNNIYSPVAGGAVQTSYRDQQATALPGDLAFNDNTLIDTAIASDASGNGIPAGRAVVLTAADNPVRSGIDRQTAALPGADASAVGGIVVRNQQMQSNSAGEPVWFNGRALNVLRTNRVGGRIWVTLVSGSVTAGDAVKALAGGDTPGAFAPTGTITIAGAKYLGGFDAAAEPVAALVEFGQEA